MQHLSGSSLRFGAKIFILAFLVLFWFGDRSQAADVSQGFTAVHMQSFAPKYYWTTTPVDGGAQLLTLFGRFGNSANSSGGQDDVPLVAVLRDRLVDGTSGTDCLRYVWLLTYQSPRFDQRLLSAMPFFFWRLNAGPAQPSNKPPKPLVDLSQPLPQVWKSIGRNLVQWTAFDPVGMPLRATTRTYEANGTDNERLHIDEALTFLREAPVQDNGEGLSQSELDIVTARLNLMENMLGGLVIEKQLERVVRQRDEQRMEAMGRNWELLRTSAERAGLLFEPLPLNNNAEEHAVLWFPVNTTFSTPGVSLDETWKLLHISDPWRDAKLKTWEGYQTTRWLNTNGQLLPEGIVGARQVTLIPLAVYSLTYRGAPLLMVNFRNGMGPKYKEIFQRASEEIVSGVLGLSHFGNWYYFAGNTAYQFVRARHGSAEDQAQRLDSYSEFRVALALNTTLDPTFRQELQKRVRVVSINPLETSADAEVTLARSHFNALQKTAEAEQGLPAKLDRDRRQEIASFGQGYRAQISSNALHYLSLGTYTQRAPANEENAAILVKNRQIESLTSYLEQVADAGPRPEVTYPLPRIENSISELAQLAQAGTPSRVRRRATLVISRIQANVTDANILADCHKALAELTTPTLPLENGPLNKGTETASLPVTEPVVATK